MKKHNIKPTFIKSGLEKYRAKSARIDDNSAQATPPKHYGSGAIYVAREAKED
ncbi:hypothetical protein [Desulfoscipio gibsoniae]|uniref:Uncharacterized protein n=1 Tax=Desulfoscipio gibsoniae DSM 7213 TaxID=767817 RepID=R4KIT0_9FIRM|nr:hypothetical protein [Desulfoscipio gibsoniae]AGL00450.1 hypothetical protein Desgi_0902 [Desulfoscipio gibsoniae DSM 7213]